MFNNLQQSQTTVCYHGDWAQLWGLTHEAACFRVYSSYVSLVFTCMSAAKLNCLKICRFSSSVATVGPTLHLCLHFQLYFCSEMAKSGRASVNHCEQM